MPKALHHPSTDLFELVPALMAWVDADGVVRRINQAYERWCGHSRSECLNRHYSELLPHFYGNDYARRAAPRMRQALAGKSRSFEASIPSPNGHRYVRVNYSPDRDCTGAVRGVFVLVTDLSDQRRTKQQDCTTEERFTIAAEATDVGFWEHDLLTGKITWSAACFRVTGFEDRNEPPAFAEFVARIHPDDRAARTRARALAEKTREPYDSEFRICHPDGSCRWIHSRARFVCDARGQVARAVGVLFDVSGRAAAAENLSRQARFDDLTGIPNRRMFNDRLRAALRSTLRQSDRQIAVVFIDIDNLKHVNETLGHQSGDRFLRQIAHRISCAVRETDIAARIGGDEFAVIVGECPGRSSVERLVERILRRVAAPIRVHGRELVVTASAGYAIAPADANDAEDLLRKADLAMYSAKRECKSTWKPWSSSLEPGRKQVLDIAAGLRLALRREQFFLDWQPRLHARTGHIQSVEALIRWRHPERGIIYPGDFIPIAEETGIIADIGRWVLRQAISQMRSWREQDLRLVPVSVNVSAAQFRDSSLAQAIARLLCEAGLPPHLLELELTESIFVDETFSREFLESMRALGVRIAIDDFGTGYSGLAYLSRFAVDILKIDQAFTQSIEASSTASLICRSILQLARDLRLTTVAEGVESENQADLLREWGCDQLQGFHCGRPMSPAAIQALLSPADASSTPRPHQLAFPAVQ